MSQVVRGKVSRLLVDKGILARKELLEIVRAVDRRVKKRKKKEKLINPLLILGWNTEPACKKYWFCPIAPTLWVWYDRYVRTKEGLNLTG